MLYTTIRAQSLIKGRELFGTAALILGMAVLLSISYGRSDTVAPSGSTPSGMSVEPVSDQGADAIVPQELDTEIVGLPNKAFVTIRSDTVDGISFTTVTGKKQYTANDTLKVRYLLKNHSMGTVLYDFFSSCQFTLQVSGPRGNVLYSLPDEKTCEPETSQVLLAPATERLVEFPGIPLRLKGNDTLTIKAQMKGYPLSAVPVKVVYQATQAATAPVALEGAVGHSKPVLEFNSESKMLVIGVDRAQRLTISAFILTGKKVNKLSCEKFFEPGTHHISFNNRKLADGVVIFKVEGAGFSETKTINLSH